MKKKVNNNKKHRMNKKGSGHFEMIIAFILFMGFMIFLFTIIKPYDTQLLTGSVIEGVYTSLEEETHTEFTKFFLRTKNAAGVSCHNATLLLELFNFELSETKTIDINKNPITTNIEGNTIYINNPEGYFYIHSSDTFEENTLICPTPHPGDNDPRIGSVTQKKVFSLKKIKEVETAYQQNYEETKATLGIPEIYEFSITAEEIGINMQKERPETGDILAKDYLTEVLNEDDGNIINTRFTITIW